MCTGIEPGKALSQKNDIQIAIFQIDAVQIGNLKLASADGFNCFGILYYPVVIEIQTRYTVIGLRFLRLLLDGDRLALIVKFYDTEALRIIDIVAEYSRALFLAEAARRRFKSP